MYDPSKIPSYTLRALVQWRTGLQYFEPGSFIACILKGDLQAAVRAADSNNFEAFAHIVQWCNLNMPTNLWGDESKYYRALESALVKHRENTPDGERL